MTAPRVNVLMPVYNPGHFLGPAGESILNQTCRDFELSALDDDSTDGSGAFLDDHARHDARMHVIHQPNQGVVATLNHGPAWLPGVRRTADHADGPWAH